MRELIYKNLTTLAAKKRDISIEEITEKNGLTSSTKRRSIYFVRGVHKVRSKEELQTWIEKRKCNANINRKFFHILRDCSSKNHKDKLMCKMRGSFYLISGASVYNIVFIHAIKIKIHKTEQ